ncbi:DUF4157 domain-containing protein [Nostoc sp. KVJ3]|nr:DUF4157 domain-containing protein [Nostoc sp. KVJ3]
MAQPVNSQSIQRETLPEEEEELQMKSLDSSTLQREALPEEEEELQMKSLDSSTLQREALPEEEEELQMKSLDSSTLQREALPEEEEELQMKSLDSSTLQREALPEEEEELQMKSLDSSTLQREALPEEEEELQMKPMVQRQAEAGMTAAPDLEGSINKARGGGEAIADNIRKPMEVAFGADFSRVKVHTDGQSDQLNQSIQARAFTTGQDVFFRQGEYNPGSRGGQELLAHELTHVVQQSGGSNELTHLVQQRLDSSKPTRQTERLSIKKTSSQPIVQCGKWKKTMPHNRNYEKRVNQLTAPLVLTPTQQSDKDEAINLAKLLDDDNSMTTTSTRYAPYKKKSGKIHADNLIFEVAHEYYTLLESLKVAKEKTKWFERQDKEGRSMKTVIIPGKVNLAEGSNTSNTVNGYFYGAENLSKRKNSSGSALYIKGHLLNDHLGGSGTYFNLVPLTAEKLKKNKTGSNDANGIHEKQVESKIKELVEKPSQVGSIKYKVESLVPSLRPARLQTQIVKDFALEFETAAKTNPTENTNEIRDRVIAKDVRFQGGIAQQLITSVGKGNNILPSTLIPILKNNAELWQLEDEKVPYGIKCSASYIDLSTGLKEIPKAKDGLPIEDYEIVNVLPSLYTAPYQE